MSATIACRAKLHADCYDGKPLPGLYDPDGGGMRDDGTFDGSTVVCDPCYLLVGPFIQSDGDGREDVDAAVEVFRSNRAHAESHPNPEELVADAQRAVDRSRPGSPYHASATACLAMARAEVKRRATT